MGAEDPGNVTPGCATKGRNANWGALSMWRSQAEQGQENPAQKGETGKKGLPVSATFQRPPATTS